MSPNTMDRIRDYFSEDKMCDLTAAFEYLDSEMRAGNLSNYRIHSCLPDLRPLSEGRHLMIQVDGIDIIKADFGLDGFIVSLVDRANEMHMFPSKDVFKTTVKYGYGKNLELEDEYLNKLYERAKEMSIYYE